MDGNWASRTVCRQCGKPAPYRIRAAAKQAHEREEKKRSSDSSSGGGQKTIAKLEEQLKAARNEINVWLRELNLLKSPRNRMAWLSL